MQISRVWCNPEEKTYLPAAGFLKLRFDQSIPMVINRVWAHNVSARVDMLMLNASEKKQSAQVDLFETFYEDFDKVKAENLLLDLELDKNMRLSKMSKGMKEKVQLILVMSRRAKIYILDEPLGGVDPASRDYILKTILKNFDKNATLLISTHMIADIEKILDEVIFIDEGKIILHENAEKLRTKEKCSIDEIFRRKFYVK